MIDITLLEQYFPEINKPILLDKYMFIISLRQDSATFNINLKIKQQDTKENHLIQFRFGMGQDHPRQHASHKTDEPHFEIEIYERTKETFSATVYFTFQDSNEEKLMNYAKGTIVLIEKIIKRFIEKHQLTYEKINELIYHEAVQEELSEFEPQLIEALYECYKNSDLIVRRKGSGKPIIIKTPHNLKKYLCTEELVPLCSLLLEHIEKK